MKRKLSFLAVSCLALSTLTCAQDAAAQRDQVSPRDQERIQKEVRHELLMLPYFGVFDTSLTKSMVTTSL
jgi:hypothetical protein